MNISEVRQTILDIETRSKDAHIARFQQASNNKIILKDELERYEELLKDLKAIETLEMFISEHQSVVDEYLKLKDRVDAIKIAPSPVVEEEKKVNETPVEVPEIVAEQSDVISEPVEEKKESPEIVIPEVEVTEEKSEDISSEEKNEEKKEEEPKLEEPGTAIAIVTPPTIEKVVEESKTPVVEEEKKEEPEKVENIIVDPGAYRLKRNEIIQDFPINDLSEQIFKTPGMSDEQIKDSQDKINAIPIADPTKIIAPIEEEIRQRREAWENKQKKNQPANEAEPYVYKPMSDQEIEESRKKIAGSSRPMTDEEIKASREKIGATPSVKKEEAKNEEKKSPENKTSEVRKRRAKRRRVTKRRRFDWKNNFVTQGFSKSYASLKGLIFAEDISKRSKDYQKICMKISNYRAVYKTRTPDENSKAITAIAEDVKISQTTYEEKVRLYKKVAKLAKQYQRLTTKQQKSALRDGVEIVEELQDNSFGR